MVPQLLPFERVKRKLGLVSHADVHKLMQEEFHRLGISQAAILGEDDSYFFKYDEACDERRLPNVCYTVQLP